MSPRSPRFTPPIIAAGGVLWRSRGHGAAARHAAPEIEVALIHRPRYDDWSIPKGKLEHHETPLDAAVREVAEETGSAVAVTAHLGQVAYDVGGAETGRGGPAAGPVSGQKLVDYWAMQHRHGDFTISAEADQLVWLSPEEAGQRVSYDLDRKVLDAFTAQPVADSVVVLVRHAKAGKRSQWSGDDSARPLEHAGRTQARRLATFIRYFAPTRIISADRVRCTQTVQPLADQLGLSVALSEQFSDEGYFAAPSASGAALRELGRASGVTVICSQGGAIPGLLADLDLKDPPASLATRKGAAWVLCFAAGDLVSYDYYARAATS